jgi:hypothetical protein
LGILDPLQTSAGVRHPLPDLNQAAVEVASQIADSVQYGGLRGCDAWTTSTSW